MPPPETVVVGAGVAGLVVARRLALGGRAVTVLEQGDRPGGALARQTVAGVDLDAGAESFGTRGGGVTELLHDLGLDADIVGPEPGPAWVRRPDGRALPLPAAGLLGIPSDPEAPDVVAALGTEGAERARHDLELGPDVGADAVTLGRLVAARMGDEVLDVLVAPVVRGVYSREARDLPVAQAHPRLRAALAEHGSLAAAVRALRASAPAGAFVAGLRGGMFRLAEALVADCDRLGVTVETGVRVDEVLPDGVVVGGRRRPAEVVLAAPRPDAPAGREVVLVTLAVVAPGLDAAPRGSGVLVAEGSGVAARALTHLSAKWAWIARAGAGIQLLRLSYDARPVDAVAAARADAAALFGVGLPVPVDATARIWTRPEPDPHGFVGIRVGEPVAGTGLASVIPHAERVARGLLDDSPRHPGRERMAS